MDTSFPYYRVAIIPATSVDGAPTRAFASDIQSTTQNIFVYSGNDASLTQISLEDIAIENEVIFAPQHIEQLENRLILANTKGKGINWCDFQKFASRISSDLATKDVILNSVESEANQKNAKSSFFFAGYMPGEVYAFNVHYVFSDGTISPGFHVPGRSASQTASRMKFYELQDVFYQDIHNCSTDNYWGRDYGGDALIGTRVRHHRFPYRSEVNIPLFERNGDTTIIQRHRLTFTIALNPAFVPTPPDPGGWPVDVDGNDLVIPYQIKYKIGSTGSVITLTRQLIKANLGENIIIYDDTDGLGDVSGEADSIPLTGTVEGVINEEAGTLSDYMDVGGTNPRFILTGNYESYNAASVYDTDESKIFGIQFSNIEKPHDDVIGFYITRAERLDDDRLVIDNAIFGPMIENTQYKSFGLLMPKQYYPAPRVNGNCQVVGFRNSGKTLTYYDRGAWFFNPEYQFFNKKGNFTGIRIEGQYLETEVNLPSRLPQYDGCTDYRGVQIQDVQAGTSFNSEVNKGSDSDGFDMISGYRNTEVNYQGIAYSFPAQERTFYLNAATYQNFNGAVLYNVSVDNKIGIVHFTSALDTEKFYNTTSKKNALLYGVLERDNRAAYANFMSRPYYKEHNNPFLFGNNTIINDVSIFNGDSYISPISIVSSTYYDTLVAERKKKSRVWQIIVGAVLVVAGVVASIFTAGASGFAVAAGIGILSAAAISYGVSLAMSGIKFEQFKNMIDNDYSKGLKDTVTDGAVFECIGDDLARADDNFRWFHDRVNSLYIESSMPFGLRDGITAGVVDFMDAPGQYSEDAFRSYIVEKLTTIDRDQGSGRLYKGYATAEFYSMNPDYMRFNKQKTFIHLPVEYDCCSDDNEDFNTRVWYSQQSFQEERIDNYRVFLPNNYRDIEGEHGEITDLYRLGNALFVHCKEVLWQLPQNLQMVTNNEIVSFIGTGEFFNVPPRKVIDDNLGSGGTQHKWSTLKTKIGVFFINEIENKVYLHGESAKDVSVEGIRNWFENNLKSFLSQQFYDELGVPYPNDNNPANPGGIGYISAYDTRHERIIITKRDYLYLGNFADIIANFDPTQDYQVGKIIIGDNGFEEITSIEWASPVSVAMNDWIKDPTGNINPTLTVPTTPLDPLVLNYGVVFMDGGAMFYIANNYDDIDFGGADHVTDIIPVDLGSCETSEVEVEIPNIPSKRCPNFFNSGGTVAYQETKIVLGNQPGQVKFLLSTYTIPDSFKIYYGEPSANILLWSTCELPGSDGACMIGTQSLVGNPAYAPCPTDPLDAGNPYEVAIIFDYAPTDPEIQHVTLVTQAPSPGTAWAYNMGCPCQGGEPVNPEDMTDWNYCQDCSS